VTSRSARVVANVVLATAGLAAAFFVFRTLPLRRLALGATRLWLGASVPVFLLNETRRAWAESKSDAAA
jgi:hypothetical protein